MQTAEGRTPLTRKIFRDLVPTATICVLVIGALLPVTMYGPAADERARQIGREAEMLACALDNMEGDVAFLQALAAAEMRPEGM